MLGFWDSSKGIHADEKIKQLLGEDFDRNAKRELLEPIAFWFHEQRAESFMADRKILQAKLAEELVKITGEKSTDKLNLVAGFLLDSARERSGLLIERENGSFAFSHLTFQEYLTARHLAYRTDCTDFVLSHLHESWWREVILLIAGHLGGENNRWAREQTTQLIDAIRNAGSEYENYLKRDLFLAAKCLIDIAPMGVHGWIRDEIADELLNIYRNGKYSLLRREAFKHLAGIGSEKHNIELRCMLLEPLKNVKQITGLKLFYLEKSDNEFELIELSQLDARVLKDLVGLLDKQDYKVRVVAAWALGRIGKSDAHVIDALIERLKDESDAVRTEVVEVLGKFGKPDARLINALVERLKDESATVRAKATELLGKFGKPEAHVIDALVERLEDESNTVRVKAAELLGEFGKPDAHVIDGLSKLLNTQNANSEQVDDNVRAAASIALGQLGQMDARVIDGLIQSLLSKHYDKDKEEVLIKLGQSEKRVVDGLFRLLEEQVSFGAISAADALIQLQKADSRVIDVLLQWFQYGNHDEEAGAAIALRKLSETDAHVVDALLPLLQHQDERIRIRAFSELGQIGKGDKRVVDALLPLLQHQDESIRTHAVSVLGQVGEGDKRIVDALLLLLQHQDENTRISAVRVLGRIGKDDERVVDALLPLLEDEEAYPRYVVANALVQIGRADGRVVDALMSLLEDEEANLRLKAVKVLIQLHKTDERVINTLLLLLQYHHYSIPNEAADVLVELDYIEGNVVSALLKFLERRGDFYFDNFFPFRRDRRSAIKIYFTQAATAGNEEILKMLIDATKSEHCVPRAISAYALGRSGRVEVAETLVRMLKDACNREEIIDYFELNVFELRKAPVYEVVFEALWRLMSGSANGARE